MAKNNNHKAVSYNKWGYIFLIWINADRTEFCGTCQLCKALSGWRYLDLF